jgi:hypothetical protein
MFGLFGKSEFNTEMDALDKQYKKHVSDLVAAMQAFDINNQLISHRAMIENCALKVQCCKKYGKIDEMRKWNEAMQKLIELHG